MRHLWVFAIVTQVRGAVVTTQVDVGPGTILVRQHYFDNPVRQPPQRLS